MSKILVTYSTMAGSTAEVAQVVGEEIARSGTQVDVLPIARVGDLAQYQGVVVGGPMILGWHREAAGFLRRRRAELQRIPVAVFALAISLTRTPEMTAGDIPLCLDEALPKAPAVPGRLSVRERYATLPNYLRPILGALRPAQPVSIGFFGGRLEFGRLKWWAILFVSLIVQAAPGDKRNWPVIRAWAADLPRAFKLA